MRRLPLALSIAFLFAAAVPPVTAGDEDSVHRMVTADGEIDDSKCVACHEEDMSLSLPKGETCTLCHAETLHSGAAEHLRLSAASVARGMARAGTDAPDLPLTDDGRIYCGTCHIFHDPAVTGETLLVSGRQPKTTGRSEEIRKSVAERLNAAARRQGADKADVGFSAEGTRSLRLPVDDASLCMRCHNYGK